MKVPVGIRHPRKRKENCGQWVGKFNPALIRGKTNVRNILKPKKHLEIKDMALCESSHGVYRRRGGAGGGEEVITKTLLKVEGKNTNIWHSSHGIYRRRGSDGGDEVPVITKTLLQQKKIQKWGSFHGVYRRRGSNYQHYLACGT